MVNKPQELFVWETQRRGVNLFWSRNVIERVPDVIVLCHTSGVLEF